MLQSKVELAKIASQLRELSVALQAQIDNTTPAAGPDASCDAMSAEVSALAPAVPTCGSLQIAAPVHAGDESQTSLQLAHRIFDAAYERRFLNRFSSPRSGKCMVGPGAKVREKAAHEADALVVTRIKEAKALLVEAMVAQAPKSFWQELAALRPSYLGRLLFESPTLRRDDDWDEALSWSDQEMGQEMNTLVRTHMLRPEWYLRFCIEEAELNEGGSDTDASEGFDTECALTAGLWRDVGEMGARRLVAFYASPTGQTYARVMQAAQRAFDGATWAAKVYADSEAITQAGEVAAKAADAAGYKNASQSQGQYQTAANQAQKRQ